MAIRLLSYSRFALRKIPIEWWLSAHAPARYPTGRLPVTLVK